MSDHAELEVAPEAGAPASPLVYWNRVFKRLGEPLEDADGKRGQR